MRMLEKYYKEIMEGHPAPDEVGPVEITSAADWFYAGTKETWDFYDDFPAVTPPFQFTWMEFIPPKLEEFFLDDYESVGCSIIALEITDDSQKTAIREGLLHTMLLHNAAEMGWNFKGQEQEARRRDQLALAAGREARWMAFWKIYMATKHDLYQPIVVAAYIDPEGRYIPENNIMLVGKQTMEMYGGNAQAFLLPFLFATSLLHAKNVNLEEIPVIPAVAKRRAREGKKCITYKTLHVTPMRQQVRREYANEGGSGSKRAMHMVRGHFKDYRKGAGLFGRVKGLYWWDMHVAGAEDEGYVVKNYAIAPPKEKA